MSLYSKLLVDHKLMLSEATNYMQMFDQNTVILEKLIAFTSAVGLYLEKLNNDISIQNIKAASGITPIGVTQYFSRSNQGLTRIQSEFDTSDMIRKCKSLLKKDDRVVWFINYIRVALFYNYKAVTNSSNTILNALIDQVERNKQTIETQTYTEIQQTLSAFISEAAKLQRVCEQLYKKYDTYSQPYLRIAMQAIDLDLNKVNFNKIYDVLVELEHFYSLPISEIQTYKITNTESPEKVIEIFRSLEQEWAKEQRKLVSNNDTNEIILKLTDGFAWFDLHKNKCSEEAAAMGHCGNAGSPQNGQTILSLRKHIGNDKWEVCLTFILDKNGNLGEMKGRANEKPAKKYHKYIIALLETPRIKGIVGGGYLPGSNFSVDDLSTEDQDKLFSKRPEFASLQWLYKKEGFTDRIKDLLTQRLSGFVDKQVIDFDEDNIVIDRMLLSDIVYKFSDKTALYYYRSYIENSEFIDVDFQIRDEEIAIEDFIDNINKDEALKQKLLRIIAKYKDNEEYELYDFDELSTKEIVSIIIDNAYSDDDLTVFPDAIRNGYESGAYKQIRDTFIDAIDSFIDKIVNELDRTFDGVFVSSDKKAPYTITSRAEIADDLYKDPAFKVVVPYQSVMTALEKNKDDIEQFEYWGRVLSSDVLGETFQLDEPRYGFNDYDEKSAWEYFKESF